MMITGRNGCAGSAAQAVVIGALPAAWLQHRLSIDLPMT
jgi:hypothetical protein